MLWAPLAAAQSAALTGHVTDESGALVRSAKVVLVRGDGVTRTTASGDDGSYSLTGLAAGTYSISASAPALAANARAIGLRPGAQSVDLQLKIVVVTTQVTVQVNAATVNTEASANASATVLAGDDLQALSDDPEDLQADLEALAGPSAGPGGSAIFIDGFSGGQLPPKESIREVRINQNPFSPEYDKLGLGRIEIFTKPGTDKYHGTVTYNLGTDWWNSRNPYATQKAPFLLQETENSFSGPITKRSSFTLDLERQAVDNGSVTNAVILDPGTFAITPFTSVLRTPQRHLRAGPHVDYQINENNYLSVRYTITRADIHDAGIGSFDLISRGYHMLTTFNTFQVIETSLHGTALNETRFQYFRRGLATTANISAPVIQVLGSFNDGGASSPHNHDVQTSYELQNNTSIVRGSHAWRFGARLRGQKDDNYSKQNFNGTFVFNSIDQYRLTLLRTPGAGPAQFTVSGGIPDITAGQFDFGAFAGDDFRVRQNFTLNLGLRYEMQSNIHDRMDVAPRIGFAWAPWATRNRPSKTVLRAGFGIFYDRFPLSNMLTADRYNGVVQQQYVVTLPDFYPNPPSTPAGSLSIQAINEIDAHLRSPYVIQSALTGERQLPRNSTIAVTYANAHALHGLRSEDINARSPGTGLYPYPDRGPVFLMTSSGLYNQNQVIVNLNSKVNGAVSLFSSYVLNKAMSNTDGLNTYPGNPYDFRGEYGPAATDVRHRFSLGGSINTRWNIRFNPLVSYQSGMPFNITAGNDPYGTTLYFARPGVATDPKRPELVQTRYGLLDPHPIAGEQVLGRNSGRGPAQVMLNLRVSKTWGFGRERGASGSASSRDSGVAVGGNLAPQGPPRGMFSNSPTSRRYNISLGMSGRNILNHNNPGPIIGNIASPLFGRANQVAGSPNGEGFSENASNRRLEMQVRFTY